MIHLLWAQVLRHVQVDGEGGCWKWVGYRNPTSGYGQISLSRQAQQLLGLERRIITVPRLVCVLAQGPAPDGMEVLHLCTTPRRECCGPHHLRWGTKRENAEMAWNGGFQLRGEKHHQSKYSDEQIVSLRQRVAKGEPVKKVAADIGIGWSYAYVLLRNSEYRREAIPR